MRRRDTRVYDYLSGRLSPLRSDGYFELSWPDDARACFFVEVDMGTETNARFVRKVHAYERYSNLCLFNTLDALHPSRVLADWQTPDGDTVDLVDLWAEGNGGGGDAG